MPQCACSSRSARPSFRARRDRLDEDGAVCSAFRQTGPDLSGRARPDHGPCMPRARPSSANRMMRTPHRIGSMCRLAQGVLRGWVRGPKMEIRCHAAPVIVLILKKSAFVLMTDSGFQTGRCLRQVNLSHRNNMLLDTIRSSF